MSEAEIVTENLAVSSVHCYRSIAGNPNEGTSRTNNERVQGQQLFEDATKNSLW